MAVHSGRFGVVGGVSTVRNWSVNDGGTLAPAVASNTAFGTARKPGIAEWSGNFGLFGVMPPSGQMPGDALSFVGYTAPDNDASGVGLQYSGTAYIKSLAIAWNWAGGDILSMTEEFDGHLALVSTPTTGPTLDASTPVLDPIAGLTFSFSADGSSYTTWTDMVSATWTLTNSIQPFVNSGTYVSSPSPGAFWTGRRAGIFDWTLSVVEQNTDRARFVKGQQLYLKLYVTASTFWFLKCGRVKDFTGIVVDRETGKIIQQTVNIEMDGVDNIMGAGALGAIIKPDTTTFWPVAQS